MVTPRAANYTSTGNGPPRVLSLQYIKLSLKYISVSETKEYGLICPLAARLYLFLKYNHPLDIGPMQIITKIN